MHDTRESRMHTKPITIYGEPADPTVGAHDAITASNVALVSLPTTDTFGASRKGHRGFYALSGISLGGGGSHNRWDFKRLFTTSWHKVSSAWSCRPSKNAH